VIVSVLDPTQESGRPPGDLVDIDQIEPDESLLADLRKTRITTPLTRVLLLLIVLGAGFLGGALVDRWQRPSSSSNSAASLIQQFAAARGRRAGAGGTGGTTATGGANAAGGGANAAAGGGAASFFGGGGAAGGATIGTVKLVDGDKVYIQDTAGDDIVVDTTPSTQITVSQPGKAADLKPGSTVIVAGKQSTDGTSIAATSISPSIARSGFGGLGGGGAAPAGG
jgi:hypothetical protein